MKADTKVISILNKVLANELVAINQYFLHSRMLGDWGLKKLESHAYEESIDEMKHADKLVQRILFLEGLPNLQDLGSLRIGQNVTEILEADLQVELDALVDLKQGISYCEQIGDYPSRDLLADIMRDEESHIDWIESQLELIRQVGLQNYTQSQI